MDVVLDPSITPVIDTKGNGSGVSTINIDGGALLGNIRIAATGGDISTDGAYQALGVCSTGCGAGNDSARAMDSSESISFGLTDAGKTAQSFALGLLGINTSTVAVSITYRLNGVFVSNEIRSVSVSTALPSSPQLTSLAPSPAQLFDEVVFRPSGTSRFFLSSFRFCASSTTCN
ncbi:MAG: hypothetical protein Q8K87_16545 [Hydrogenophaga sp.]|uniref:hypothetical protein n=1 Tax=Hydrogenophaga sp. TaxID=1904254 RepID=UPI002722885F|nr:hypothetical protein [Hydrogenophaga sp.]MDO9567935.1 hypothetical protein [Hydrogenophaga sp.]MDP1895724.1 hypothetical protein [Hydrogenophaga sp.]MDP3924356.1 hypothetical protein [Hydrogenophaga sp.]